MSDLNIRLVDIILVANSIYKNFNKEGRQVFCQGKFIDIVRKNIFNFESFKNFIIQETFKKNNRIIDINYTKIYSIEVENWWGQIINVNSNYKILYNDNLNTCHKKFVIIKELCSVYTTEFLFDKHPNDLKNSKTNTFQASEHTFSNSFIGNLFERQIDVTTELKNYEEISFF